MFAGAQRLALTQTHCRLLTGGLVGGGTWQRQSPWTRSLMTIELVQVLQYLNRNPENLWTQAILEPWWSFNLDTTHHRRSWARTNSFATGAVIGRSSALMLMSSWSIMKCLNIWSSWVGNSNLVLEVEEAVQVVGQQMRMRQDDKEAPTWKKCQIIGCPPKLGQLDIKDYKKEIPA